MVVWLHNHIYWQKVLEPVYVVVLAEGTGASVCGCVASQPHTLAEGTGASVCGCVGRRYWSQCMWLCWQKVLEPVYVVVWLHNHIHWQKVLEPVYVVVWLHNHIHWQKVLESLPPDQLAMYLD